MTAVAYTTSEEGGSGPTTPLTPMAKNKSQMSRQWRVLLVDDHATARNLLRILLEECEEIQVVGEASDGEEAVALAEQYRPDVILMDIHLPGLNGVEATRRINQKLPQIVVIGVSMQYSPHSYNAMITAGAVAFVRKEDAVEALYKTIEFSMHAYGPTTGQPSVISSDEMASS
jgi:DNA-binding NarL/FixJ family response regulator